MKTGFAMSLVSAALSLAAVLGFSAISIVPRPGAETYRTAAMGVSSMFFLAWLVVAFWARTRQRAEAAPVPRWLRGFLLVVSAVYSLGLIFGILA
jgi:hypothetical protein